MTTVIFVNKTCFICGASSRYPDIGVVNIGKQEDLDGRPSDSHRSAIYMLTKRCPSCGYCAVDISSGPLCAAAVVKDPAYQAILNDKEFPETANTFLCWAMIQVHNNCYDEAGQASLFASWVCDDDSSKSRNNAIFCRKQTILHFQRARELRQPFGKTALDEQLLLIDLMRRCSMFDEAQNLCKETLPLCKSERNEMIIDFQQDLIKQKDARRYTISEALNQ